MRYHSLLLFPFTKLNIKYFSNNEGKDVLRNKANIIFFYRLAPQQWWDLRIQKKFYFSISFHVEFVLSIPYGMTSQFSCPSLSHAKNSPIDITVVLSNYLRKTWCGGIFHFLSQIIISTDKLSMPVFRLLKQWQQMLISLVNVRVTLDLHVPCSNMRSAESCKLGVEGEDLFTIFFFFVVTDTKWLRSQACKKVTELFSGSS